MRFHWYIIIYVVFVANQSLAQSSKFETKERKLVDLYNKISSANSTNDIDSLMFFSDRFEKNFVELIKNNPTTIRYPFKRLTANRNCYISTSIDGKFRIYSWDDGTGGTMRYFSGIIQWESGGKIFSRVVDKDDNISSSFCSKIYLTKIGQNLTYFAVTNSIGSTKDASQAISAFRIAGNNLIRPKLFTTKSKTLNFINVDFDFFSVVDRPERPLELITYNDKMQSIFIPLVDNKGKVNNKVLVYQLKSNGNFEYSGTKSYKFN